MKKTVLGLFLIFAWNAFAWADVPKYISFQGELTDSQGTRITTSKTVTFTLYKSSGGTTDSVWSEVHSSVTPSNGIVSVSLGSQTAGGIAADFKSQYWLGVKVSPDANEMTPRVKLTTSPYAFIARNLDTGATAYGALTVAETVTATAFVGNGAGLTGINAMAAAPDTDWIVDGVGNVYRSAGNVGIGTTSPSDSLHIKGSMRLVSNNSETFTITGDSGFVGIGLVGPKQPKAPLTVVINTTSTAQPQQINQNALDDKTGLLIVNRGNANNAKFGMQFGGYFDDAGSGGRAWSFGGIFGALDPVSGSNGTTQGDLTIDIKPDLSTQQLNEIVRISRRGRVGIGTSTPSDSLSVNGSFTADSVTVSGTITANTFIGNGSQLTNLPAGSASPDTDWTMTATDIYRSSGNVGIGTATPAAKLDVNGGASIGGEAALIGGPLGVGKGGVVGGKVTIFSTTGRQLSMEMNDTSDATIYNTFGKINITPTTNLIVTQGNVGIGAATPATPAADLTRLLDVSGTGGAVGIIAGPTSDNVGAVNIRGGTANTFWQLGKRPAAQADRFSLYYYNGSAYTNELATVSTAGNLGIGATSPADSLHVAGRIQMDTVSGSGGADGAIRWSGSDFEGRKGGAWVSLASAGVAVPDTDWTMVGGASGNLYRIAGNVGIGTTTPSDSLHVNGTVRIADTMAVADTVLVVGKANGRVGIGTAAPASKLHILTDPAMGSPYIGQILIEPVSNSQDASISLKTTETGIDRIWTILSGSMAGNTNFRIYDSTENIDRLNIDSRGNVGIGTTSPGDSLHVNGTLRVEDTMVIGDTWLTVTKGGLVGIGTTTPARALDVIRNGVDPDILNVHNLNSAYAIMIRYGDGVNFFKAGLSNSADGYQFQFRSSDSKNVAVINQNGNVGVGTMTPVDSMHIVGTFRVISNNMSGTTIIDNSGNVGIGVSAAPEARLHVVGVSKFSDSVIVADTALVVNKQTGKIGIGTASPDGKLQINEVGGTGGPTYRGSLILENSAGLLNLNSDLGLEFGASGGSTGYGWRISNPDLGSENTPLVYESRKGSASWTERMRFSVEGSVGIGTTAPSDSLHVAGPMRVVVNNASGTFVINNAGNVGVGTASPTLGVFQVNGNTYLGSSSVPAAWGDGASSYGQLNYASGKTRIIATAGNGLGLSSNGSLDNLYIDGSGNVGIGTTSPDTNLSVNGGASKVGGGSWATFSDGRLKNVDREFKAGSAELMKLNPVRYRYKSDNPIGIHDGAEHIGLVAQEVQAAIPEAVSSGNKGYLMLDNDPIIFTMLNAIKEQKALNDAQTAENAELKLQIQALNRRVAQLEGE